MSDSLNTASGRITIDTSQAEQAPAKMAGVAQGISQAMTQVSAGTGQAAAGLTAAAGAARSFGAALGIGFGAAGIIQIAKAAIESDKLAVAYNRQRVAAEGLAGSQGRLNDMLEVYDKATGGILDKSTELDNVTKLMSVGFADSTQELEQFAKAIRGMSIAMGESADFVTQNLILEMFSQQGRRLDQIGLEYGKVRQRADELQKSDSSLTQTMAYQQAVLDEAQRKFGKLADSSAGARSGIEAVATEWKNLRLEIAQEFHPGFEQLGQETAKFLSWIQQRRQEIPGEGANLRKSLGIMELPSLLPSAANFNLPGVGLTGGGINPNQGEIDATKLDWAKGIQQLNADTNQQLLDQNRDYQEQRASSEAEYQKSTLRAAEDFALSRQREEQDMADSILRIHREAAEREDREAADLARTLAEARRDSDDRIGKAKRESNERLDELDKNYEKARVKRAKDLSDKLLDAAGDLNSKQVYELQRDAAKQEKEAKEAHDDQRDKLQKQLAERIDDERKSLDKSIKQTQDAYDRRLIDERDAEDQRIQDMKDDLKKRQDQENTDYGIRMGRMAQDHRDQLDENARQQGLRIQQIKDHAAEERTQLDTEHESALNKLGTHNQEWIDAETKLNNDALKLLEPLLEKGRSLILFPNAGSNTLPFPSMVGSNAPAPYSAPGATYSNSSRTFSPTVNVNITGGSDLTQKQVDDAVHDALMRVFRETGQ